MGQIAHWRRKEQFGYKSRDKQQVADPRPQSRLVRSIFAKIRPIAPIVKPKR